MKKQVDGRHKSKREWNQNPASEVGEMEWSLVMKKKFDTSVFRQLLVIYLFFFNFNLILNSSIYILW